MVNFRFCWKRQGTVWVLIQLKFAFWNTSRTSAKTKYCFSVCQANRYQPFSSCGLRGLLFFFVFFLMTWSFSQSRWRMWTHDILTHFQGFWLLASPCNPAALTRRHLLNSAVLISSFFSLLKPATSLISCPCSCLYTKSFSFFLFFFLNLYLVRLFLLVCVPLLRASLSARFNTHPATFQGFSVL